MPLRDAFVVERLKAAGAIIMGKTVTTELAFMHPGQDRATRTTRTIRPADPRSGSAAAVADGMVPLAIGTQTGGSVIRPASFCGVTGFKPTFGAIPRRGILTQSPSLDTVGVFAADPEGAALLAEALFGHDDGDPATMLAPHPRLLDTARSEPPLPPVFAFVKPPGWAGADRDLHDAFDELADALGEQAFEVNLPSPFDEAAEVRQRINFAEMARCYYRYWRDGRDMLGPETLAALEEGNSDPRARLHRGAGLAAGAERASGRDLRALRRDPLSCRAGACARLSGHDRRCDLQRALDLVRDPGRHCPAADGRERAADGGATRRSGRRRRPSLAHSRLA